MHSRKKHVSPLLLSDYMYERVRVKRALQKFSTSELYEVAVRHFLRFVRNPKFVLQELTPTLVSDFTFYLQGKGLSVNTINTYQSSLRAIYNAAFRAGLLATSMFPFKDLRLRREMTRKRAVDLSYIHKIAQIPKKNNPQQELAIDITLFSFMACGMPFVDIVHLTKQNIRGKELVYHRRKTGTCIRLEITSGMWKLIRKYSRDEKNGSYIFPILSGNNGEYGQYKYCLALHNKQLKKIGEDLRLTEKLTSYVIRHTWASAALRCDVPVAVISQALGHTSEKTTRYYLNELDVSELARANQKVSGRIDYLLVNRKENTLTYL